MARSRNIKPGLFKNEVLGVADPLYTLLFEGLWLLADREGRLEDRPLRIKAEVFPYREGLDVNAMLGWLQSNGFIRRYHAVGVAYIQIEAFAKHQNPHKNEPESAIPPPNEVDTRSEEIGSAPEIIGSTRADSLSLDSGFLIPEVGSAAVSAKPAPPSPPDLVGDQNLSLIPARARVKLAQSWELPEQWGVDAEALGWKSIEILREAEKFRQYYVSGKGQGTYRSIKGWRQGWSNWLSKAEKFGAIKRVA